MSKVNILNLPKDCILEIIKYILLDCEINGENIRDISVKYIDLVNFIVVDESFEGTFEYYYKNLYKELEFSFVANRLELSIKFYELYERIKHFSEREQDVFWRTYSNSIKQNHVVREVELIYDPDTYWSGYLDAYELCKEALRNKKSVKELIIKIKGYTIDDLEFLENIQELHLEARTTAAVLVNFCKANPNLIVLKLDTSDIYGQLSDITNFCPNLEKLCFHMKAGVDEAEYEPLKKMPKLRDINLVSGKDKSPLKILAEMNYSKRSEIKPMELTIRDSSEDLVRAFRVALCDSLRYFKYKSEFIGEQFRTITEAKYDICDTFQEKSALEASICLDGINFIQFSRQYRTLNLRLNVLAIRKLGFLSQLPDLERLEIEAEYQKAWTHTEYLDTIPFENIKVLHLKARTTAAVLVNFCKANPNLRELKLCTAEIDGRLSDITNFCPNLEKLCFHMKAGVDEAEYEPLKKMPKLRDINLVSGKDKSPLKILAEMNYSKRSEIKPMELTIRDSSEDLVRAFRVALCDSLQYFKYKSEFIGEQFRTITEAKYDICDTFQEKSVLEASICLDGINFIQFSRQYRILNLRLNVLAIRKLGFLSQLPDLERLEIEAEYQKAWTHTEYLDTIPFENIKVLHLKARTTAAVLVNFCKANPNLRELKLCTAEIDGRLSDITNFCPNLEELSFHMKAGVDEAEYGPLKKMPKLRKINLVSCEDTSPLKILGEMNYLKRSEIKPMELTIRDSSEDLVRAFRVALCDSLQYFKYKSEFIEEQFRTITEAKYDICDTFQEKSVLEASICLDGINFIEFRRQDRILTLRLNVLAIRKLGFLSQLPDLERLEIGAEYQKAWTHTEYLDTIPFENIKVLHLKARTTAAVLVNFCKANPNLRELKLYTAEIDGRLSDITNFCPNLEKLSFHMKPEVDEAEYGPLKKMPKLRKINLVSCEDTSPLKILGEMNYLKRSEIKPMELTIRDSSEDLVRAFRVALCDSLQYFKYKSEFIGEQFRTKTEAKYDICDTFQELSALEASDCFNFIEFRRQDRLLTLRLKDLGSRKLGFLSQLPDLERLEIEAKYLDTIPFKNIKELELQSTTINAKALVDFCVSNPDLNKLNFINTDWIGNIAEIVSQCPNLQILKFELPSGANIAEYTPLVLQPKLRQLFIKVSIEENNTLTPIYNEMKFWNSPRDQPLLVHLHATFLASYKCTLGRLDILKNFRCFCNDEDLILVAEYDYGNEGRNPSLSEDLEVSIYMEEDDGIQFFESGRAMFIYLNCGQSLNFDIFKMLPKINFLATNCNLDFLTECVLNCTHISYLIIESKEEEDSFVNLFRTLSTTKLINLNGLIINDDDRTLDQFEVAELAKIKSLRLLECSLLEQDYVKHLSKLTKLQFIKIDINSWFSSSELGLWDWLAACENIVIMQYYNVKISIHKYKRILKIKSYNNFDASDLIRLSALRDIEIVEISGKFSRGSLNKLFEAFSLNSACTVIELDISKLNIVVLEDISNITQIQSIKKLKCFLLKIDGIEKLAQLPNIEDLSIKTNDPASLVSLFEALATKKNPAIRYLEINERNLRPEEVVKICQLPFLSRLQCSFHNSVDGQYLTANSNIEELSVVGLDPNICYENLFAAFSQNTTLKHLAIYFIPLEMEEISEISKMKGLKIFETNVLEFKDVEFLWRNSSIEHLVIKKLDITSSYLKSPRDTGFNSPVSLKKMVLQFPISFRECQYLIMLESLESLECQFEDTRNINILADLKNLKVLIIKEPEDENEDEEDIRLREYYWELYRDLALKKSSTLKELHAPINSTQELYEIKKIKSLNTLNISYSSNIECLVELTDLETLYISDIQKSENIIPIFRSCKKLSFVQLKFKFAWRPQPNFVGELINILKLVRNPEIQKPLQLKILYDMGENIELDGIDSNYLETKLEFLRAS